MKISLLRETVSVKRFHKETNAVYLHQPDIDDKLTEISEDEMENSEYLVMPVYKGARKKYFRSDKYATEHPEVDCTIDYPLSKPCNFKIHFTKYTWSKNNEYRISVEDVVDQICNKYREIYEEEEKSSIMEVRSENTPILNRGRTDGKWGIWGHGIGDLVIEGIVLDTDNHRIELYIGS